MPKVEEWLDKKIEDGSNNGCTMDNAVVRREWYICQYSEEFSTILIQLDRSDMSETQRQDYVAAVTCLMKLPPTSNLTRFPGALSRYDDFVAYHMTHASKYSSKFLSTLDTRAKRDMADRDWLSATSRQPPPLRRSQVFCLAVRESSS